VKTALLVRGALAAVLVAALTVLPLVSSAASGGRATSPVVNVWTEPTDGYGFLDAAVESAQRSVDLSMYELSDTTLEHELVARANAELQVLLSTTAAPNDALVQRWPDGLPQYYIGHESMVKRARAAATSIGATLCGNSYDGVGIPASVGSGRRAGRDALELLHFSYH